MTRPAAPPEFDPISEASFRDPASIVARAREERPVFFYEPLGVWVVTRREDVDRCITDVATFTSTVNGGQIPVPEAFACVVSPELMRGAFIAMDPPEHTPVRKVGQRGFTRPRVAALEPRTEASAHALADGLAAAGDGCELLPRRADRAGGGADRAAGAVRAAPGAPRRPRRAAGLRAAHDPADAADPAGDVVDARLALRPSR